jgi:hypothetical protein
VPHVELAMVDAAPQTTASIQDLKAIDANEGSFKI